MFTKEGSPQSDDTSLENISGAVERYLDGNETAQGGEYLTEEEAIKSILEKVRRASSHGENIPDEDGENLEIAMGNVYISKRLLNEHNEFSRETLINIVFRLNEAKEALGKLSCRNRSLTGRLQIGRLQKKLDTKANRIFDELAKHTRKQMSGDEQRTEIKLKTILKKRAIKFLREAEKSIKSIRESSLSIPETPTS